MIDKHIRASIYIFIHTLSATHQVGQLSDRPRLCLFLFFSSIRLRRHLRYDRCPDARMVKKNVTGWWFETLLKILVNWDEYSK